MKLLKALLLVATVVGSSAAFADDQHLTDRLAISRTQQSNDQRSASVAVYANGAGAGQGAAQSADPRIELRDNGHGQLRPQYIQYVAE